MVEYEIVVFIGGFWGDIFKFLGLLNEVDDYWDEFYNSMYFGKVFFLVW